jgi:hypothetical protein
MNNMFWTSLKRLLTTNEDLKGWANMDRQL